MWKAMVLLLLMLFSIMQCTAQIKQGQARIDSLVNELTNYQTPCINPCIKDSVKVKLLYSLAWDYCSRKPDSAEMLINQAVLLSNKINWSDGLALTYNTRGWLNYNRSLYSEALSEYFKALNIWEELSISKSFDPRITRRKGMTYANIGLVYSDLRELDSALFYHLKSLKIKEELHDEIGSAKDLSNIGIVYKNKSDYDNALNYYERALSINRKFNINESEAKNLGNIGNVYVNIGMYNKAIDFLLQSLRINETLSNKKGVATQLSNIARVYHTIKDESKAIEYCNKAINAYEELGNQRGVADNIHMLGEIAYLRKNYDISLDSYNKALVIYESLKFVFGISKINGDLGNLYADLGDIAQTSIEQNEPYNEALKYYRIGLEISRRLEDLHSIALELGNIGSLNTKIANYSEAEKYLVESEHVSIQANSFYSLVEQYKNLAELYKLIGKPELSVNYYEKYIKLNDSLFNESKKVDIAKLELNYIYEKKETQTKVEYEKQQAITDILTQGEISILEEKRRKAEADKKLKVQEAVNLQLKAENQSARIANDLIKNKLQADYERKRIIQKSNIEIEEQKLVRNTIAGGSLAILLSAILSFFFYKRKRDAVQKQKDTFHNLQVSETEMKALRSQMNPHFIFNALQSIQTFLLKHKADEANMYLLKFSKLMRAVLENSLQSEVPLKKDMQALELYMQLESIRLPYPFTYMFHLDQSIDPETALIPPLILQPFVENAIWHGLQHKPGPGQIDIFIKKNGTELLATVEDNGVGRDMSRKVEKPMLMNKESLGMKLTEERLKILNEQKKINAGFKIIDLFSANNQPAGTRINLVLPAAI